MTRVESVNVAVVRTGPWTGRMGRTGIDKRPVAGPLLAAETGVRGDTVCDAQHHGAWYQAVYAFDTEELRYWSSELGSELVPGNAGENLSLTGCDCSDAVIGERWRVGGAVLRVTPAHPVRGLRRVLGGEGADRAVRRARPPRCLPSGGRAR